MDDPDWRSDNLRDVQGRLESFLRLIDELAQLPKTNSSNGHLEQWLRGKMGYKSKLIADAVENLGRNRSDTLNGLDPPRRQDGLGDA